MKTVGLIHTVKVVADFFEGELHKQIDGVRAYNLLDDYLSKNMAELGMFTPQARMRFLTLAREFEIAPVDAIVCTCSSISPIVPNIKGQFRIPFLTIDQYMMEQAARRGSRVLVAATVYTALQPVVDGIRHSSERLGRRLELNAIHCPEAGRVMASGGDMAEHDALVLESLRNMKEHDLIVLAQASMMRLQDAIEQQCGIEVMSAPRYCIAQLKQLLQG